MLRAQITALTSINVLTKAFSNRYNKKSDTMVFLYEIPLAATATARSKYIY